MKVFHHLLVLLIVYKPGGFPNPPWHDRLRLFHIRLGALSAKAELFQAVLDALAFHRGQGAHWLTLGLRFGLPPLCFSTWYPKHGQKPQSACDEPKQLLNPFFLWKTLEGGGILLKNASWLLIEVGCAKRAGACVQPGDFAATQEDALGDVSLGTKACRPDTGLPGVNATGNKTCQVLIKLAGVRAAVNVHSYP